MLCHCDFGDFQVMKEVQSALSTAAADDSKLVLLSAVGSVFCCGLDFIYFIRRLTDDRKRESTKMAEAIRYAPTTFVRLGVRLQCAIARGHGLGESGECTLSVELMSSSVTPGALAQSSPSPEPSH